MKKLFSRGSKIDIKVPIDPKVMPSTGQSPAERLALGLPLFDTPGHRYVESRGIPVGIAHDAGVRFDADWNGRPAVIVAMRGLDDELCSVHGRYLQQAGDQNKMFTFGPGGGILNVGDGLNQDKFIIVEGLFDALSLAVCGFASLATVGRKAPWLPQVCKGKTVFLAFDANRPGELSAMFYKQYLVDANIHRLTPPGNFKDWNSALVKKGKHTIQQWLRFNFSRFAKANSIVS